MLRLTTRCSRSCKLADRRIIPGLLDRRVLPHSAAAYAPRRFVSDVGVLTYKDERNPNEVYTFEFIEEPLGFPLEEGFGYIELDFGEVINNRYEVKRKLGWGLNSSVWLSRDLKETRYVSTKVLTMKATDIAWSKRTQELDILQHLSSPTPPSATVTHCMPLLHYTFIPDKERVGLFGRLCIVSDVFGASVSALMKTFPKGQLPVPLVKRIISHVLHGLTYIHKRGVVHTDLKPSNILIDAVGFKSTADIDALLADDPSMKHPPERSVPPGKWVQAAVSQPLPVPSFEEAMSGSFILTDFGSAQFIDSQVTNDITPLMLRAPETLLEGPWNEKVDIWVVGCLIYEFLTGAHLFFKTSEGDEKHMPHLQQMAAVSGDHFKQSQLSESKKSAVLLKPGTGLSDDMPPRRPTPISGLLGIYCKEMLPLELQGATSIIERCLRLDPKDRPSAKELLNDPWLMSAGQQ